MKLTTHYIKRHVKIIPVLNISRCRVYVYNDLSCQPALPACIWPQTNINTVHPGTLHSCCTRACSRHPVLRLRLMVESVECQVVCTQLTLTLSRPHSRLHYCTACYKACLNKLKTGSVQRWNKRNTAHS